MSDVDKIVMFVDSQDQSPQTLSASLRLSEPTDDRFLPVMSFYLQPGKTSSTLQIGAGGIFCNDSFQTTSRGDLEKVNTVLFDVVAKLNMRKARQTLAKQFFAACQRKLS